MAVDMTNPVSDAVVRMAKYAALMYYHLTKAMVDELGKEKAEKIIREGIHEFGLERGRNIAKDVKDAGEELTIENLDRFYDMPIAAGWAPSGHDNLENPEPVTEKHSTTQSCTYADLWMEKDWAEIGRLYCNVDDAIREGYSDHIDYKATKIVLDGDDVCSSVTTYK